MASRTTNAELTARFQYLKDIAAVRGVNVDGWRFGQNYGTCYNIITKDPVDGYVQLVSQNWTSKTEAWYGMGDMIEALKLVPRV